MSLMKEQARKVIDELPEDSTFEDLMHELYVMEKIARRAELADAGVFVSQDEAEARMQKWPCRDIDSPFHRESSAT